MIDWNNTVIMGPCAMESFEQVDAICKALVHERERIRASVNPNFDFIFKASYSKANRTKGSSFHGVGRAEAKRIFKHIKKTYGVRVTSDVHSVEEITDMADILSVIQIPHSLSRYTSIIQAAAKTGLPIVIKKGLFLNMDGAFESCKKAIAVGTAQQPLIIERGIQCGPNDVLVDVRNMTFNQAPTCIDASHPAGSREMVEPLALAGIAAGANTIFMEVHLDPDNALCDGHHMLTPKQGMDVIRKSFAIKKALKR